MRAALRFVELLDHEGLLPSAGRVRAEVFGSPGATGHRPGSDKTVVLPLEDGDMKAKYKETARCGLAVDVIEC